MQCGEAESSLRENEWQRAVSPCGSQAGLQALQIKPRQCGNHWKSWKALWGEDPASGFPFVGRIGDYCSWKLKKREEFTFQIGQRKIQHSLLFSCDPLMAGDGAMFLNGENLLSVISAGIGSVPCIAATHDARVCHKEILYVVCV